MSIDPHVIWSERFEQLGTLLEESADAITHRWSDQALQEQSDARAAHYDEMHNKLPEFIRSMGRALASSGATAPRPHAMVALEHGEQRWRIGWQLGEVIRDYQILRLVILEHFDNCLETPLTAREVMAIGLALDEAISASVLAYVGHQESQLRAANARLIEVLPILGHELRNPLSAVVSAMEVINLYTMPDAVVRDAHEIIDRQIQQMTRLLDDLLDVSRIVRGKMSIRTEVLDLRTIVRETVEWHRPTAAQRDQILMLSLPDEPCWVQADPARARQILSNLLTNATKYSNPKGRISVELERVKGRILIHVRDKGVGIPVDVLPHVFEMFAQAPQHAQQGMGIGLALVRALVQLHGGDVKAFSGGDGKGSEFVVELPEAAPVVSSAPTIGVAELAVGAAPCYRLLLVDDHEDSGQTLAVLLERGGHEVRVVQDGRAALRILSNYKPDVVLIDIGLPGMDGYELASRLRQKSCFARTPLVAISGFATDSDRQRAKLAGFDDYLAKPVEFEALQALLSTFRGAGM